MVCAWCGMGLGEKEPREDQTVSHGICDDCRERHFAKLVGEGEIVMKNRPVTKEYYRKLRALHPYMSAVKAIKQARAWVRAGYLDIRFYDYIGDQEVEII